MSVRKAAGLMMEPTIQLAGWSRATKEDVRLHEVMQERKRVIEERPLWQTVLDDRQRSHFSRRNIFTTPELRRSWLEGEWYEEVAEFKEASYKGVTFNIVNEDDLVSINILGAPVLRDDLSLTSKGKLVRGVKPLCRAAQYHPDSDRKLKEPCPWCGNYHE